jgi:hypothetical protein
MEENKRRRKNRTKEEEMFTVWKLEAKQHTDRLRVGDDGGYSEGGLRRWWLWGGWAAAMVVVGRIGGDEDW